MGKKKLGKIIVKEMVFLFFYYCKVFINVFDGCFYFIVYLFEYMYVCVCVMCSVCVCICICVCVREIECKRERFFNCVIV